MTVYAVEQVTVNMSVDCRNVNAEYAREKSPTTSGGVGLIHFTSVSARLRLYRRAVVDLGSTQTNRLGFTALGLP